MFDQSFARMRRVLVGLACFAGVCSSEAQIDFGIDLKIGIGKEIEREVAVQDDRTGPPPWAPAHGRRAKAVYHYYLGQGVYRNAETGVWFVYRDGKWSVGANLPSSIQIGSNSAFVTLGMDTEQPFQFHDAVSDAYPSSYGVQVGSRTSNVSTPPGKKGKKVPPGQAKKKR